MNATQFDALLTAADGGIQFEGLYAHAGDEDYDREGGYAFGTPDGEYASLSEGEFHEVASQHPDYVTNWYFWHSVVGGSVRKGGVEADDPKHHRRAFVRWLEHADEFDVPERYDRLRDGIVREWGELRTAATLVADGDRRYEIRHVDDAGADTESLDVFADPLEAREIRTLDERGRYRPLKTAPSLRAGWALVDLDQRGVFEAVETFYPATVANWNLERHGELDVDHWRETAERQTGIYDIIDELPDEAVAWIAESCCVDSQCLKRREWQLDEETELPVDGGDGRFPCREPCSLVVAAARKWTTLEEEGTETYEFELTPSEKAQLEALVDAVADGRTDEIREADVYEGANRYRARYLRAKRFDDEGRLPASHPDEE
ncbi:DR2241 family protein [Haloferacaceae archaeon DSL9]